MGLIGELEGFMERRFIRKKKDKRFKEIVSIKICIFKFFKRVNCFIVVVFKVFNFCF